jgi:malate/lactate dehydrogenase
LLSSSLLIISSVATNINFYSPNVIVITETNPVAPLNYAMYLVSLDKDRQKHIGYSLNDNLRFIIWSAEALGVSATRGSGITIGDHGNSQVMLFGTLLLDGKPVTFDAQT